MKIIFRLCLECVIFSKNLFPREELIELILSIGPRFFFIIIIILFLAGNFKNDILP